MDNISNSLLQNICDRVDELFPDTDDLGKMRTKSSVLTAAYGTAIALEEYYKLHGRDTTE